MGLAIVNLSTFSDHAIPDHRGCLDRVHPGHSGLLLGRQLRHQAEEAEEPLADGHLDPGQVPGHLAADLADAGPAADDTKRRFDDAAVRDSDVATFLRNVVFVAVDRGVGRSSADVVQVRLEVEVENVHKSAK